MLKTSGTSMGVYVFYITLYFGLSVFGADLNCNGFFQDDVPQLHPDQTSKSAVVAIYKDKEGIWYKMNFKISQSNYPVERDLGLYQSYQGDKEFSLLPHPETMNQRLKAYRPTAQVRFVAVQEGTLRLDRYLEYLGQGQIPVGMRGQYIHDLLDHSGGYVLLSESGAWKPVQTAIQMALLAQKEKHSLPSDVSKLLSKINSFLETATTSLPMLASDEGPAYRDSLRLMETQALRLQKEALELGKSKSD